MESTGWTGLMAGSAQSPTGSDGSSRGGGGRGGQRAHQERVTPPCAEIAGLISPHGLPRGRARKNGNRAKNRSTAGRRGVCVWDACGQDHQP